MSAIEEQIENIQKQQEARYKRYLLYQRQQEANYRQIFEWYPRKSGRTARMKERLVEVQNVKHYLFNKNYHPGKRRRYRPPGVLLNDKPVSTGKTF